MTTAKLNHYLSRHPDILLALSRLEDRLLRKKLHHTLIQKPLYITGLARSGTTILLEYIAQHPEVVTHRYRDFPYIYIPYFWQKLSCRFTKQGALKERAHRDRLLVNAESPESMEEILWAYFLAEYEPLQDRVLDQHFSDTAFETFYRQHIRKLLVSRKGTRYASKANYCLTRIRYLHTIFPDARFIIMVRNPSHFVASCLKQDRLFSEEQHNHPSRLLHTNSTQHFEFGLNKRIISFGDNAKQKEVAALLQSSERMDRVHGWATYWNEAYQYVLSMLADKSLEPHLHLIHYEQLCSATEDILTSVNQFCDLPVQQTVLDHYHEKIQAPDYYQNDFSDAEQRIIEETTSKTAKKLGYTPQ